MGEAENQQVQQIFADGLNEPVRLVVFTQQMECQFCAETRQLAEEIAELSALLTTEVYDFVADSELAQELGIDKIPAIAVVAKQDYGVRLYGIPSGYEFTSLIEAIVHVSAGASSLSQDSVEKMASISEPVHIQVFVTPTCPYCPGAVVLAHRLAIESDLIRADMVEAIEFPHLANKYDVMGVPRTIINESSSVEGMVPEQVLVQAVLDAAAGDVAQ